MRKNDDKRKKKPYNSLLSSYKRLFSFMKPYRMKLFLSVFIILIAAILNTLAPLFSGLAINELASIFMGNNTDSSTSSFLSLVIIMLLLYSFSALLTYIGMWLIVSASENTIFDLRKRIDIKLSKLPLNYYDSNSYGDILSIITNDVDTISSSLQQSIYQILNALFNVVLIFILMLSISPILTLIGLSIVPFGLRIASDMAKRSKKYFDKQQDNVGTLNGYVEEYYSGHKVVTAFGKEKDVIDNFEINNDNLYENSRYGQFYSGTLLPITQSMSNFGYALVATIGGIMCSMGGISIGMIQSFIQYLRQFSMPITQVLQITNIIQLTASASSRIFKFLDEEEEVKDINRPEFPKELKGNVKFEHVSFGYLPHQKLIHDLNLDIEAGSKTAIVGPTGAGKTTLVNLIMRFYDVTSGAIKIDGIDIRDMKRGRLREIFGMVLQDTWLYSGTIKDNIRYGKFDATDQEVKAAAKAARADEFIKTLPGGYDFILHEGAENIAQGQRQLITIARAMLNNPPIMILDEATSSVDTRTEVLIQEAMDEMTKGKTSFIIAHRLSTIVDAKNIMYMQDGDILEIGTHDELIKKNGYYAKLYNSQFADSK